MFGAVIPPSISITVIPTLGPDFGLATSSPNFDAWATNVVNGMINSTTPGSGVQAYVPLSNGANVFANAFIATPGFSSWQGSTPGLYPSEYGTALYFSVHVAAVGGASFTLDQLGAQETYLGQTQPQYVPGDFGTGAGAPYFTSFNVGRLLGGGLTTGSEPANSSLVDLYYVGVGFVQGLDPLAGGSNQNKIDVTAAGVMALADRTTQVCYFIGGNNTNAASNCGSVNITAAPTGVPEPGTLALLGLGLAGVAFLRRRSA